MRFVRGIRQFFSRDPEEKPLDEALATAVQQPSAFLEHLEALRRHLLRILVALVIGTGVMFSLAPRVLEFLARPLGGLERVQAIEITEPIGVFMRIVFFGALGLVLPYVAFELWLFIAPGLRPAERRGSLLAIPLAGLFFLAGVAFAYYVMLPVALPVLLHIMNIPTVPRPLSYLNFVAGLLFWTGVLFEFPLVVFLLTWLGMVKPGMLVRQWRLMILMVAILAAVITPTGDPLNMTLAMVPMIVLYFAGVGLSYLAVMLRRRK